MMKISTKGQYALLIMTELAEQPEGKFIPLKLLSHRHNLSVKYLEQILIHLSKAGLVIGVRGSNGGYKLVKKTEEYTTGEILRALEGDLSPINVRENNVITDTGNDDYWKDFEVVINNYVDSVTLDKLVEKNKENTGWMYYI
ncbi:MAG: Rrf2 family transcriptional regulator [Treponema sp.]|nr:Rrf2 family transcriptional regulator [Treponema sp.]